MTKKMKSENFVRRIIEEQTAVRLKFPGLIMALNINHITIMCQMQ